MSGCARVWSHQYTPIGSHVRHQADIADARALWAATPHGRLGFVCRECSFRMVSGLRAWCYSCAGLLYPGGHPMIRPPRM